MGIIMITLAVNSPDTLVDKNWYKDGMAINQRLDKQHQATQMGIQAFISLNREKGIILVNGENLDALKYPELLLELTHPTLESLDHLLPLYPTPEGNFFAKPTSIPSGYYYVRLSVPTGDWEIQSSVNFSNPVEQQALSPNQ